MENSYGIGVANRYALFLDEEEVDPFELLKAQELEKEAKKKTKLSEKENKGKTESKGKPSQLARKGIKETQNVKALEVGKSKEESNKLKAIPRSTAERTERNVKFASESREERNNRRNREDRPIAASGDFTRDARDPRELREPRGDRDNIRTDTGDARGRGRGSGRGLGRGRGSRGAGGTGGRGGYDNRGKREFDRQSGSDKTGVKPVDKREGGGAHNWGNHKDDIEELNTSTLSEEQLEWSSEKPEDAPPVSDSAEIKDVEGGVEDPENAQPTDEEPRELTLDEYYAMRGSRQKPTFNLRKAGEGEDPSQWKKMYALKKKEGEEEDEEEEEYDASEYPQRVGRQKHVLDIDIHFTDSRRGTRGRGRGGPRGAGGRGGPRGVSGLPRSVAPGGSRGVGVTGPTEVRSPILRERFTGERTERFDRDRVEREPYQSRGQRQSAPKVDDENDFPSLG